MDELPVHVYYFFVNNNMFFYIFSSVFNCDVSLLSSQAIFVSTRACDSKRGMCTASVDSVMEIGASAFPQHSKGNLLYSAATTQSTMDYSSKVVEDGVVDSPPSREVLVAVNSPSPLQRKAIVKSLQSNWRDSNGAQRNLYLGLSLAPHRKMLMVLLLYHLPSSCTETVSFSCQL